MLRYCHTFAAKLSFGIVSSGGKSKFFSSPVSTVQVGAVQVPPHRWATPDKTFPLEQLPHLLQSTGSSLTFQGSALEIRLTPDDTVTLEDQNWE